MDEFLTESRVKGSTGDEAKKITVKLWGKGVFEKEDVVQGSANTQYYRRSAGQFIYSKLDFLNQAFGIVPSHLDGFESTVDLPCFDVSDELNSIFLLEYVQRKGFYKKLGEMADGGRKAKRIQVETFLSFPIYVPESETEQQKIADCLSSLDELIAAHSRKLDALKAHKKGLMQQLFPHEGESLPRLRFPEFKNAPDWELKPLGDLFETTTGGTPARSKNEYWGGEIPWITTSLVDFNVIFDAEEFITQDGLENSSAKLFPKETVLLALYGQGITRGKVAMLGIEASTNQACGAILPCEEIEPRFTFLYLCNRYEELRGLSNSGGQKNLSQGIIRELPFAYPEDAEEQKRIVSCLTSLNEIIESQTQKLERLAGHKTGLMQQLFPSMGEGNKA